MDNLIDTLPNGQFVDVAGRPRSPYFNEGTFIAAPLISDNEVFEEDQEYTFYLDPQFFVNNDYIDIKQIRIDFGDGQGEWVVDNPFSNETLQRTNGFTNSISKKIGKTIIGRIVVIGIDLAGHWIRYGNPFEILAKKKKEEYPLTPCKGGKGGGVKWVIEPNQAALNTINNMYGNPILDYRRKIKRREYIDVKDTAYFFFKEDGNNCTNKVVKRPVIFIDGFDPTNDRMVGDIYQDYINVRVNRNGNPNTLFGDYMLDNGNPDPNDDFEFIILDFKHGNDLLERNALTLVALIERLNQTYGSNYLQDITLIGPSMGSLIAQYALSYMEHNNIQHRVKTYISFDGCHQGANVPIGLQNYVEYITKRGILKNVKSIREGMYNGLAARQMLAHHQSANSAFPAPDALRTQFLNNLAAVGEYPQISRKVALINGAKNGILNPNHGTNSTLLDIEIKRKGWKSIWGLCNDNICKKIKWTGRTATNSGSNKTAEMWTASPLYNVLFWVPLGNKNYYTQAAWGNSSQDNAPGGLFGELFSDNYETHMTFLAKELIYLITGDKPSFNINLNNFTMMPSYSAADIRYPDKNLYRRIDECPPTPFDYIYAPLENEQHVYVSESGSWWFENEARGILPSCYNCNNYAISGTTLICNSSVYTIPGLPQGAKVIWSIPTSAGPVLELRPNIPQPNQLTINNKRWYSISTTLTASISNVPGCGMGSSIIITKPIANDNSTSGSAPYSYYQEACTFYNVYHPSQSGTVTSNSSPVFVHQGCMVYVNLGDMTGRTVTLGGGGTPLLWGVASTSYYPNTLYFKLPLGSGGIPFTFNITGDGACYTRSLLFFSYNNNSRYAYAASPNPANNQLTLTIKENEEYLMNTNEKTRTDNSKTTLNIFDMNTSKLYFSQQVLSGSGQHTLNVSSLKPGYYVLQIVNGEDIQSIKFKKE